MLVSIVLQPSSGSCWRHEFESLDTYKPDGVVLLYSHPQIFSVGTKSSTYVTGSGRKYTNLEPRITDDCDRRSVKLKDVE